MAFGVWGLGFIQDRSWINRLLVRLLILVSDFSKEIEAVSHGLSHFLQMIYSKVEYVGCADIIFLSSVHLEEHISEGFLKRFVCNYGPAYSLDEPLYEEGPPCSKCKYGCSQRYENLCASKFSILSTM